MMRLFLISTLRLPFVANAAERPNILWIISDDLGPELGCYGYPDIVTPNVDRLAASGRLDTHAFTTSPVCSSSRSAFQTGRYQTSIGCHHHLTRQPKELPESVPTAIGLMRKAGYFISHGLASLLDVMPTTRPKEELYDLSVDPREMTILAGDPSHAEKLAEMPLALDVQHHPLRGRNGQTRHRTPPSGTGHY